jgi:hypothetical protein
MFFHAGFDPALTWRNLTTELRDVGLACLENGSRTGAHLRHRPGCAEQQDGTSNHDSLLQHDRSSIAFALPWIAVQYRSIRTTRAILHLEKISRPQARRIVAECGRRAPPTSKIGHENHRT